MVTTPREVYTSRYYRHGNSYGFLVPPDIRDLMGLHLHDMVAMILRHDVLIVVKVTQEMLVNRDKVSKIFDQLFPDKAGRNGSE